MIVSFSISFHRYARQFGGLRKAKIGFHWGDDDMIILFLFLLVKRGTSAMIRSWGFWRRRVHFFGNNLPKLIVVRYNRKKVRKRFWPWKSGDSNGTGFSSHLCLCFSDLIHPVDRGGPPPRCPCLLDRRTIVPSNDPWQHGSVIGGRHASPHRRNGRGLLARIQLFRLSGSIPGRHFFDRFLGSLCRFFHP